MKIAIIGTTSYQNKMHAYKQKAENLGHRIRLPVFDNLDTKSKDVEYQICSINRELIRWADEVHIFWDQRSMGAMFDVGMCFALRKTIRVIYLETKTFGKFLKQYEKRCRNKAAWKKGLREYK